MKISKKLVVSILLAAFALTLFAACGRDTDPGKPDYDDAGGISNAFAADYNEIYLMISEITRRAAQQSKTDEEYAYDLEDGGSPNNSEPMATTSPGGGAGAPVPDESVNGRNSTAEIAPAADGMTGAGDAMGGGEGDDSSGLDFSETNNQIEGIQKAI